MKKFLHTIVLIALTATLFAATGDYQFFRIGPPGDPLQGFLTDPTAGYLYSDGIAISTVPGSASTGNEGIMVDTEAELRAALLVGTRIYVDGQILLPGYVEMAVPYTELIGINGGELRSTWTDTSVNLDEPHGDDSGWDYNHVIFANADNLTIRNLKISSIHGGVFDGFTPITQTGNFAAQSVFSIIGAANVGGSITNVITTSAAHGFIVGDRVILTTLTGGTGLSTYRAYFVTTVPTATTFTVSTTSGGATTDFTTDITAATIHEVAVITGLSDTSVLQVGLFATGYGVLGNIAAIDSPTQVAININHHGTSRHDGTPITFRKNYALHYGVSLPSYTTHGLDNLTIENCHFDHLYDCITCHGGPTTVERTNVRIIDCTFTDFYDLGIVCNYECRNWWVHRNKFYGRTPGETHSVAHNCIYMGITQDGHSIQHNECAYADRMGIEVPFTVNGVDISHNWCHDLGSMGISLGYSKYSQVNHNLVQNVRDIGIEIAGYYDSTVSRGRIGVIGNNIDGVEPTISISTGITVDQVGDVIIQGNHISNISDGIAGFTSSGIEVVNGGFEAHITNNVFRTAGFAHIRLNHGGPRNYVANNDFYLSDGDADANAVYAFGTRSTIINNRSHRPTGLNLNFYTNGGPVEYAEGRFATTAFFDGSNTIYDLTTGAVVPQVTPLAVTGSVTLDFPSTPAQQSSDLTITATGAAVGDPVALATPVAAITANTGYSAWVSAANTVTVRHMNFTTGASDPASGTFKVEVSKR